jgi:hypothetical protein
MAENTAHATDWTYVAASAMAADSARPHASEISPRIRKNADNRNVSNDSHLPFKFLGLRDMIFVSLF